MSILRRRHVGTHELRISLHLFLIKAELSHGTETVSMGLHRPRMGCENMDIHSNQWGMAEVLGVLCELGRSGRNYSDGGLLTRQWVCHWGLPCLVTNNGGWQGIVFKCWWLSTVVVIHISSNLRQTTSDSMSWAMWGIVWQRWREWVWGWMF